MPTVTAAARLQFAVVRGLLALPHPVLQLLVGRPSVVEGESPHIEAQLAIRLLELQRQPELTELTPAHARARVSQDAATFAGRPIALEHVEDTSVDGAAGRLRARLYVPTQFPGPNGLLVFFHGGGFVVGDLDTHDNSCRFIAEQAGVRVLAVEYRLAPEAPFPAAAEDALAAFRFAVEHASELGVDRRSIAVGGDSAGGNLAAGVALSATRDGGPAPTFQLLLYPWLDLAAKSDSYRLFREGFYLTEADLDWYRGHYIRDQQDALDPRCSPGLAEDLQGVPPAYIATAGFDPLRDEAEAYARRLREAGVPVALRRQAGLIHGFFNTVALGSAARHAMLEAAGALRMGLALAASQAEAPRPPRETSRRARGKATAAPAS